MNEMRSNLNEIKDMKSLADNRLKIPTKVVAVDDRNKGSVMSKLPDFMEARATVAEITGVSLEEGFSILIVYIFINE